MTTVLLLIFLLVAPFIAIYPNPNCPPLTNRPTNRGVVFCIQGV
jgi:hypothetical protein